MAQVRRERARRLARRFGAHAGVALSLGLVALLAAALAIGLLVRGSGGGVLIERAGSGTSEAGAESGDSDAGDPEGATEGVALDEAALLVHVDGAVAVPGVYELSDGDRVKDAVEAAGGLAEGADTSGMNLAARVADGDKVYVPLEGEEAPDADAGGSGTREPLVNILSASTASFTRSPSESS